MLTSNPLRLQYLSDNYVTILILNNIVMHLFNLSKYGGSEVVNVHWCFQFWLGC